MNRKTALAALCSFAFSTCSLLQASNAYLVRNLVSDIPDLADHTDPNLKGAWGISESGTSPFWISDAGAGVTTLYDSSGDVIPLVVSIPASKAGGAAGVPTGTVFSAPAGFNLAPGMAALFMFASLDGTISGWNPQVDGTHSVVKVDNSASGASYFGLAISIGASPATSFIYAANLHAGTIDVFDMNFAPVATPGGFKDAMLPAGYAPFNIQNLGGKLYVTYALQTPDKSFAAPGAGNGYVDVFDTSGNLLQRLIAKGPLNAPWGLALAPAGFGDFANDLLVGNFGDGTINVFNPSSGAYIATLNDTYGTPIVVPNLWALQAGNGGKGGDAAAVYFTAGIPGPDNGNHGLLGRLQAAPQVVANGVANAAAGTTIAPNTWVSIKGANVASTTRMWDAGDFVNGALPTVIDGVSATVNGEGVYVYYVSPTQLNVLIPADATPGPAQIVVDNSGLTSATVNAQIATLAPAFFLAADGRHLVATHANGTLVGPASNTSSPAKPGETIVLYGTGFGQTNPPIPNGKLVTAPAPVTNAPTIMVGGTISQVPFAGLVAAGLYQFNVTIPATTPDGDNQVVAQVGGQVSPIGLITVQH
jgi:uncharacterized protein (TIGR03118 family)